MVSNNDNAVRIAQRDVRFQNLKGGGMYIIKRHPRDENRKGRKWQGHLRLVCFNESQTQAASHVMTRIEARQLVRDIGELLGDYDADSGG